LTPPRIAPLPRHGNPPRAQGLLDTARGGRGGDLHLFRTMAHHPGLLDYYLPFGGQFAEGVLPAREREMLILRTSWVCGCAYEWGHHERAGQRAGLTTEDVAAVPDADAERWSEDDRALLLAADALVTRRDLDDDLWRRFARPFDAAQLVEATMLVGSYAMLAAMINAVGIEPERGLAQLPHVVRPAPVSEPEARPRRIRVGLPRVPPVDADDLPDDLRPQVTGARESSGGENIFLTMAHSPDLLRRYLPFGGKLLLAGRLPPRQRELAILRSAWVAGCVYEWQHHVPLGLEAGVHAAEMERLRGGLVSWEGRDALVLAATDQLTVEHTIRDATWQGLAETFDDAQMLELAMLVGHYAMLAGMLTTLGVALEPGFGVDNGALDGDRRSARPA